MVTVTFTANTIKAEGHAMSGEHGQDLVCNSVSVLMQALEIGVNPKFLELVKKESGYIEFKLYPPAHKAVALTVMTIIKFVADTIRVLADENPEYIEVVIEK